MSLEAGDTGVIMLINHGRPGNVWETVERQDAVINTILIILLIFQKTLETQTNATFIAFRFHLSPQMHC